jgi:hypothetical protein
MSFEPSRPLRERILVFGGAGSGKSRQGLAIAQRVRASGHGWYCIDTDDGIERLLATEFPDLDVELRHVSRWPAYVEALEEFAPRLRPGDWLHIDLIDYAWDAVQAHFIHEVYGKGAGEFFLDIRKSAGSPKDAAKAVAQEQMWPVVNKLYKEWINPIVYELPCHVYACATTTTVGDRDDKEVRKLYPSGVRPAGQKHLSHQFHTIIQFDGNQEKGEWHATTIRDRGREPMRDERLVSFPVQYLVKRAGWRG